MKPRAPRPHRVVPIALALTIAGLVAAVRAQSTTVPAARATKDAPALGWTAGLPLPLRQQIVIGASHLRGLTGKRLAGVWLRRDASSPGPRAGGLLDLEVWISASSRLDPGAPASGFAANHHLPPVRVFRGKVVVPSSPPVASPYDPWAPKNTIRITFATPFAYGGGTLCLEIRGHAVPGNEPGYWALDYDRDPVRGSVTTLGKGCARLRTNADPLSAWPSSLRAGATAMLTVFGRPGATAMLLLSPGLLAGVRGVPLAAVGAPGCTLFVAGDVAFTLPLTAPLEPGLPALATQRLELPADPRLLGASFHAQAAILEWSLPPSQWTNRLGLTTTNAMRAGIAPSLGNLGLAVVERAHRLGGPLPSAGTVRIGRGPVLRLVAR